MADPSFRSFSQNYANGTSNVCPYPAGIVAGDRLFLLAAGPYHPSALAGWDILFDAPDTNFQAGTLFTKIAAGTESGTNVTLTFSNSDRQSVSIVAVADPAGYPVIFPFNASSGAAARYTTIMSAHSGSLMLYMANLRDGLIAPTLSRGSVDLASTDGARESAVIGHETLTTDEEVWQYYNAAPESGVLGNGYFGATIEMQPLAYTRDSLSAYDSAVMADSPILYWKLAVDAQDSSGNARHGTVNGRWHFGRKLGIGDMKDGSMAVDGASYIVSPSFAVPAGKIAVECWADTTTTQAMLWSWGLNYQTCWINAGGTIGLNNGSSNIPATRPIDGIHHVVWEYTPGTDFTTSAGKLYIDGVLRATTGSFTPVVLGTTTFRVSGWSADTGYRLPYGYMISNVAVYSGGLSAARVAAHWAAGGATTTGTGTITDIPTLETAVAMGALKASKADGAKPQFLTDVSRKRRHMAAYAQANRGTLKSPATPAGMPSMLMGNAYQAAYLFQRGLMDNGNAGGEMFVLMKHTADPPTVGDGRFWQIGSDGTISHIPHSDGTVYDNFGTSARKTTANPAQSFAAAYTIYNVRSAAGAWSNYVESTLNFSTATNSVAWSNAPFIGWPDGNEQNTELVAFLLFSEVLSAPNRAIAMAWMDSWRSAVQIHDMFAGATTVTILPSNLPASMTVDSTGYTTEGSEPLTLPTDKTGWAHFIPMVSGVYQIDTIGSNFDTGLAIYTGASLGALTLVASDNDSGGSSTSKLTVTLMAGTLYHIQVGSGTGSASGTQLKLNYSVVSQAGSLSAVSTAPATQGMAGWLYKGRSNQASDALSGG